MSSRLAQFDRGLGLTVAEITAILDQLDRLGSVDDERRSSARHPFRVGGVTLGLVDPASGKSQSPVYTRNLSAGGIALLHKGFIHAGSQCVVRLPTKGGKPLALTGTIVCCRHIDRLIHEVCVRFDEKINLDDFMASAGVGASAQEEEEEAEGRSGPLSGRVLCIDHDGDARGAYVRPLIDAGLTIWESHSLDAGLDRIRWGRFDVVVCASDVEGCSIRRIVERIREVGYGGLVILIGRSPGQVVDDRMRGTAEVASPPDISTMLELIERGIMWTRARKSVA